MHTETLAPNTKSILDNLSLNHSVLDNFYLSGGTALALHLGHRESEDLDFFTQNEFDPQLLQTKLEKITFLKSIFLSSKYFAKNLAAKVAFDPLAFISSSLTICVVTIKSLKTP